MQHVARWRDQLADAQQLSAVVSLCMEISAYTARKARGARAVTRNGNHLGSIKPAQQDDEGPHEHDATHHELLTHLCGLMWSDDVPHTQRKQISRACFSLCRNIRDYSDHIGYRIAQNCAKDTTHTGQMIEQESIVLYGMIHSKFLKRFHPDPLFAVVQDELHTLFQSATIGYNRWFYTVGECVLMTLEKLEDFPGWNAPEKSRMWMVTLVNLESPYRGVRELMLRLLKQLVQSDQFALDIVLRTLERWNWQNRNKYHLLALLLRVHGPGNVLRRTVVPVVELEQVLVQSLRYEHLLSGGQAVLRAMPSENVHRVVAKVLQTEGLDICLLRSMAKYWFTTLSAESHSAIFDLLELNGLTTDEQMLPNYLREEKFERLFIMVNLFQREFQKQFVALEQLLRMLCRLADSLKPISAISLGLLIKTLTYHIIGWRGDPADRFALLTDLLRFMLEAIEMPDCMALSDNVVQQCRILLEKGISFTDERWGVVPRLLYDVHKRYLRLEAGRESAPYQQTITALRLFTLLIEQCFEFPQDNPYRLTPRPQESVPWLVYLRPGSAAPPAELLADLHDDVFALTPQLRSVYDDVCIATAKLLYNQPNAFCLDASLLSTLPLIQSNSPHQLLPLLASMERELTVAVENVRRDLYANASLADDDQQTDELQLHQAVGRASQVCFGIPKLLADGLPSVEPLWAVTRAVASVVETALNLLNVARPDASSETHPRSQLATGTSFEVMDCSMQQLLDRSPKWAAVLKARGSPGPTSCEAALPKRAMQTALWKALRAAAIFTEKYALWLLDHSDRCPDGIDRELRGCLQLFGNVLRNCCHRGAIESSAHCLGRVVRRIMQDKAQRSRRLMQPARHPGALPPDTHVERFFQETLAVQPDVSSDFRQARGYLFLLHSIMLAETDGGVVCDATLLHHYLQRHVALDKRARAKSDAESDLPPIGMLELHQLNMLMKAAAMNDAILPYADQMMIVALEAFRRPDWPVRNAALQLYTSCTTRLLGQRHQYVDALCDWAPVFVSLDEMVFKMPRTVRYIQQQLQMATNGDRASSTAFLLVLLEFLTRSEHREYGLDGPAAFTAAFRTVAKQLLGHNHDQVRRQAARCYVQLTDFNLRDAGEQFRSTAEHLLRSFFSSSSLPNRQHGLCVAVDYYVRRYVTLRHFAQPQLAREEDLATVRRLVAQHAPSDGTGCPASFWCRTALLHFLMYIGFDRTDPIVLNLLLPYEQPGPCNLGYEAFIMAWNQAGDAGGLMPYEIEIEMDREPDESD